MDFCFRNSAKLGQPQNASTNLMQFALRTQSRDGDRGMFGSALSFSRAHWFEKADPIFTLRNRDGEAPWPVPITCIGWPLPQFGVPQSTQSSAFEIASHEFQNSVVMPL